eukprot:2659929-Rhodomonas_salina.1
MAGLNVTCLDIYHSPGAPLPALPLPPCGNVRCDGAEWDACATQWRGMGHGAWGGGMGCVWEG